MKSLLSIFALLLALCASAQYPPPYVHNYWSTNLTANDGNGQLLFWGTHPNVANQVVIGHSTDNVKDGGVAVGAFANSSGTNNTAVGFNATAGSGNNASAFGANSSAGFLNSTAIGQGATAAKANQLMLGSGGETRASGALIADGVIAGDGSGLTNLPASSLTAGTNISITGSTISGPRIAWGLSDATHATNTLSKGLITVEIGGVMTATSFVGSGAGLTALHAENLVNTVDDARLGADVALWSVNSTPPTMAVNTNAVGGLNFGATAVLISSIDVSITNNVGVVIERRLSQRWNFTTGSSPSPTSWGTNTFPAFTQINTIKFGLIGQGWLASAFNRQLIATTNGLNPLTSFAIQEVSQNINSSLSHELGIEIVGK